MKWVKSAETGFTDYVTDDGSCLGWVIYEPNETSWAADIDDPYHKIKFFKTQKRAQIYIENQVQLYILSKL